MRSLLKAALITILALTSPVGVTNASGEEDVIALGFEEITEEPHPSFSGGESMRFGAGFAASSDGSSALLYGGRIGEGASLARSDTWRFDGDSWQPLCGAEGAPAPCGPGPRSFMGLATGPTGIALYGGTNTAIDDESSTVFSSTFVWQDDAWKPLCQTCPPGPRVGVSMAGNGEEVLLFGGFDRMTVPNNETWLFDGTDWTLANGGGQGAPSPRAGAQLAWDGEHFVLFGGMQLPTHDSENPTPVADTWIWDGTQWQQECGSEGDPCGPPARFTAGFSFLDSPDPLRRGALLAGGFFLHPIDEDGNEGAELLGDVWFWNGTRWLALGSPWTGGFFADEPDFIPELAMFPATAANPEECEISLIAAFPSDEGGNFHFDTKTYGIGFDHDRDGLPDPCPPATPEVPVIGLAYESFQSDVPPWVGEGWDGVDVRWTPGFAGTPDGESAVLYGGIFLYRTPTRAESDTWIWDGASWTPWCGTSIEGATDPCGPGPRVLQGQATAPNGVLLYGGSEAAGPGVGLNEAFSDAWLFSDGGWSELCDDCPPGSRNGASLAGNGSNVLLFGGSTGGSSLANDTWLFDGASWTLLDAGGPDAPEPRIGAELAWDGEHYVLFGGMSFDEMERAVSVGTDTWIWDETEWVRACAGDECGPPARVGANFSHLPRVDGAPGGALLVGGTDYTIDDGSPLGDIWLWDGDGWTKLGSPWVDRFFSSGQLLFTLPAFGASAARTAACSVSVTAAIPTGPTLEGTGAEHVTWNIGFDTDDDGVPDPCPEPTPVPSATPSATVTPRPTATPGPSSTLGPVPPGTDHRAVSGSGRVLPRSSIR